MDGRQSDLPERDRTPDSGFHSATSHLVIHVKMFSLDFLSARHRLCSQGYLKSYNNNIKVTWIYFSTLIYPIKGIKKNSGEINLYFSLKYFKNVLMEELAFELGF